MLPSPETYSWRCPERVAVVIRERIAELLRRASGRDAVVEAMGLRDALLARSRSSE
jgi:hypothetical protein